MHDLEGVTIEMPIKKPRGGQLTALEKAANQALADRRVSIEHVNSNIKRCRILKDVCRLLRNGVRDLVMEICGVTIYDSYFPASLASEHPYRSHSPGTHRIPRVRIHNQGVHSRSESHL